MKIKFINVGSSNSTWVAQIQKLTYESLYKEVKGAIWSNDIEFKYDDDTKKGSIIVGCFRQVGEFEVINDNE